MKYEYFYTKRKKCGGIINFYSFRGNRWGLMRWNKCTNGV